MSRSKTIWQKNLSSKVTRWYYLLLVLFGLSLYLRKWLIPLIMHWLIMCAFRSSTHYPMFVWIKKKSLLCTTYVGQFVTVLSIILIALLAANRFFLYKIDSIFVYKILLDYISISSGLRIDKFFVQLTLS